MGETFQEIPTFFFLKGRADRHSTKLKNVVAGHIYLRFIEIQVLNPCWPDVFGKKEETCKPSRITFLFYILSLNVIGERKEDTRRISTSFGVVKS